MTVGATVGSPPCLDKCNKPNVLLQFWIWLNLSVFVIMT